MIFRIRQLNESSSGVRRLSLGRNLETDTPVNADALYSLTFVSEIFSSSSPFVWFIQPANGFFPDVFIVFMGKILGINMGGNFIFYSSVYYVLLFLASTFLLTMCGTDVGNACI